MFEGVSGTGNSSNRLGLHLAKRSPDGVCSGNVRNRRPPRRRVLAACAKQNALLAAPARQLRADSERFAVRRFASNSRMRCVSCYTQTRAQRQTVDSLACKTQFLESKSALPSASRVPTTEFCESVSLAAISLSGGACMRRQTATVPILRGPPASSNRGGL